jgi:hypothetical protein
MNHDEWRKHCEEMEAKHPALHDFLETWGKYCGAPRVVFRGHLCKMLRDMQAEDSRSAAGGDGER